MMDFFFLSLGRKKTKRVLKIHSYLSYLKITLKYLGYLVIDNQCRSTNKQNELLCEYTTSNLIKM